MTGRGVMVAEVSASPADVPLTDTRTPCYACGCSGEVRPEIEEDDEMIQCQHCGMRADADPIFHQERYGHWPVWPDAVDDDTRDEVLYPDWMTGGEES